ncbi:TetR/AcrR family transcriptional regulator [Planomonospora parontospora]|uniref:TetR/AcrR family transcriptional regulator n=1 Tax=Planomonospora parontospora TaxID=58119 RepID=UPI0019407810|nr:TetR/AcrR family transcriptional regulator [Planomonospora parontospora]
MRVTRRTSAAAVARRSQIIEAAIETIAELGYGQASFARIAERAGLSSTRLISYHFENKDELIGQVVQEIYQRISRHMAERVGAQATAAGALRAYIEGNVEFIAANRARMRTLYEVFLNHRAEDGGRSRDAGMDLGVLSHLEAVLRRGQESGEFRGFDVRVMAVAVQRAVEGLPFLLEADPGMDPEVYARETAEIFELATRGSG